VSKHWTPNPRNVGVRPSRIRRDPVPIAAPRPVRPSSPELDKWMGAAGILAVAIALAVAILGLSAVTLFRGDPMAGQAARFSQCYAADGPNCVLDGDTIYVGGEKVAIAGLEAPSIDAARCPDERSRGIDAALRLANLLNSGRVTVGVATRDSYGREVRKVQVKGEDVRDTMIAAGAARSYDGKNRSWC
jgi:micrococcal nuclease